LRCPTAVHARETAAPPPLQPKQQTRHRPLHHRRHRRARRRISSEHRIDECPTWNHELDGIQNAIRQRNIIRDQQPEHIEHRGLRHRKRRIEVAIYLPAGPRKINLNPCISIIRVFRPAQRDQDIRLRATSVLKH
jgi:hypothetical protein